MRMRDASPVGAFGAKMHSMERDKRPDREGYLDFKLAIENGNEELKNRAERKFSEDRDKGADQRSTLSWYYDLWFAEEHLEPYALGDELREKMFRDADERTGQINDPEIRARTWAAAKERIEVWDDKRFQQSCNHIETCEWSIKKKAAKRQAENPNEREAESWFWAKFRTEQGWVSLPLGDRE